MFCLVMIASYPFHYLTYCQMFSQRTDQIKHTDTFNISLISLGFKIVGNIWENVSAKLNTIF